MDRKKIIKIGSLVTIVVVFFLFFWGLGIELANLMNREDVTDGPGVEEDADLNSKIFSDVLALEGQVYDFINDELDAILIAQDEFTDRIFSSEEDEEMNAIGNVAVANKNQLSAIAQSSLAMIEDFSASHQFELTASLKSRLTKLRLGIVMRLLDDIGTVEKIIDELPGDAEKLGVIVNYIAHFTKTDENRVRKFVEQQATWAVAHNSRYQQEMETSIFNSNPLGKKFPNHFKDAYSVDKQLLNLENFNGKYVLVDFWASWCLPCVAELPYIKEMHSLFSPEDLVVLGISLDADRVAFERFVENYQVRWLQYFDNQAFAGKIAKNYGVLSLPSKFLLDENGIVVMANDHAKEMLQFMKKKVGEEGFVKDTASVAPLEKLTTIF